MGDNDILNTVLRTYFTASNFNVLNPPASNPVEIDHFFEVQHIVGIILPIVNLGQDWSARKIGEFMDLSSFVNDHRNMFQISRISNQKKKAIPLETYPENSINQAYLRTKLMDGSTVEDSVGPLAEGMRDRVSEFSVLTRFVGKVLCDLMGW